MPALMSSDRVQMVNIFNGLYRAHTTSPIAGYVLEDKLPERVCDMWLARAVHPRSMVLNASEWVCSNDTLDLTVSAVNPH